jgi:SOS-response transcriptional repressor LexA
MYEKEIGKRIRYIREQVLNLTGKELGKLLSVSQDAISSWERGVRRVKNEKLMKIAELGQSSLEWLLKGEGIAPLGYPAEIFNQLNLTTLGARINYLRKLGAGEALSKWANKLEIKVEDLVAYEKGKRLPPFKVMKKMAKLGGVGVDFMLLGKTKEWKEEEGEENRIKELEERVKRLEERIGRTLGELDLVKLKPTIPVIEKIHITKEMKIYPQFVIDWITLPQEIKIPKTQPVFGLRMWEDSMEPKILEGDYLIIEKKDEIKNEEIIVGIVEEEVVVRKAKFKEEEIELLPFNSKYKKITAPHLILVGIVYGIGYRNLREGA